LGKASTTGFDISADSAYGAPQGTGAGVAEGLIVSGFFAEILLDLERFDDALLLFDEFFLEGR